MQREFDEFLNCGVVEYGFLRVRCQDCHGERLVAFSCKRRGFSLHADVAAKAHQQRKLERFCRYIARPAVTIDLL